MKALLVLASLILSFNSFAAPDLSCLDNSTFTMSKTADGSIDRTDKRGQLKVDVTAGGKYIFLSAVGPHYMFQSDEFFMVLRYDSLMEYHISMDGKYSVEEFCGQNKFYFASELNDSVDIVFKKL